VVAPTTGDGLIQLEGIYRVSSRIPHHQALNDKETEEGGRN
jgi:hypothetical protein